MARWVVGGWIAVIVMLCVIPLDGPVSRLGEWALRQDDWVHAILFLVLGWTLVAAISGPWPRRVLLTVITGAALAAGTEVLQMYLPWTRSANPVDFAHDLAGLAVGITSYLAWQSVRRHNVRPGRSSQAPLKSRFHNLDERDH